MLKNIIMYSPLLRLYPWLGPVWRLYYLRYALSCISENAIQKTLFCECGGRAFFTTDWEQKAVRLFPMSTGVFADQPACAPFQFMWFIMVEYTTLLG